jgi:bis(5'-nucleosyl)-tetraphosphatase (symmetrical)
MMRCLYSDAWLLDMTTYAIGDVQGCFSQLQQLLTQLDFQAGRDTLWLVGDLVNRGPDSLAVLRYARSLGEHARVVLGNHDLHLLAVYEGLAKIHRDDTLASVLAADDVADLMHWLRQQPLMHRDQGMAMVHAGLLPAWSVAEALGYAHEVQAALRGPDYRDFLGRMYGNQPVRWHEGLTGMDRLRLIVNSMTRMRMVTLDGDIDLQFKGERDDAPANLLPWFAHPQRRSVDTPIICGHWSALGLHQQDNIHAIDTGCLWGGALTALQLDNGAITQLPCPVTVSPVW